MTNPGEKRPDEAGPSPELTQRVARMLATLCIRRPVLVLVVGLGISGVGAALASQLSLQTDLSELLPPSAPSVIALKELNRRVGGTGNVAIAVESLDGKPAALRVYVPLLVEALRRELGTDLLSVKYSRRDVDAYFGKYGPYYVPLADLKRWSARLHEAIGREANPGIVNLEGDDEQGAVKKLVEEVRDARAKLRPNGASDEETGLFMTEGGKLAVVFVRPAANSLNLGGSKGVLERIQRIVDGTQPTQHGVRVPGYTGSIPSALTEVEAIRRDIVGTALLVIALVGGVVIVYFRGLRELLLLSGALVVGATVAMGFAEVWIGHVNAQTAFLGSIIVGTGINYGIILLDRYRLARVREATFEAALERAIAESLRATWIAALATAVSFGVLAAGEVESFHQFGWIGGLGILACWAASFTIVPASVVLVDQKRAPRPLPSVQPLVALFRGVGWVCVKLPLPIVLVCVGLAVWSVVVAARARDHWVETDMSKLGSRTSATKGIEKLDSRLRVMDDRSSTPAVIATDSREDTLELCKILLARAQKDLKDIITRCASINDLLPLDLDERRPIMARLAADLARVPDGDLSDGERKEKADLLRALAEPPPEPEGLPLQLKEMFVERDGSIGKLAYVDPRNEHIEANLYLYSDAIRRIELPSGKVIRTSGETVVFADVLRAMRRDTRKLTVAAAVLVLVLLALVTRRVGTFVRVGGALVLAVAMMVGAAVLLGQKLNFFNFVALPTTFGIGIDYAINVEERLRQRGRRHLVEALAEAGPAVSLASLTSIFGYASLITADNRALSSFGELAIIGEVACTLMAFLLIPAMWALIPVGRDTPTGSAASVASTASTPGAAPGS